MTTKSQRMIFTKKLTFSGLWCQSWQTSLFYPWSSLAGCFRVVNFFSFFLFFTSFLHFFILSWFFFHFFTIFFNLFLIASTFWHPISSAFDCVAILLLNSHAKQVEPESQRAGSTWNFPGKIYFWRESVWALADCERNEEAPGLKSLHLPRAPQCVRKNIKFQNKVSAEQSGWWPGYHDVTL